MVSSKKREWQAARRMQVAQGLISMKDHEANHWLRSSALANFAEKRSSLVRVCLIPMSAMDSYQKMLLLRGEKKQSEELMERLVAISGDGKDPKGKDVSKYWNGKLAPASRYVAPLYASKKGPKNGFRASLSPLVVYSRELTKILKQASKN